ncbi:cytochrome P450 [Truncatella angustata]|uniref:Cytochrome P450 n=1 Tax=Truncatella angustata TaxID=152316 RepID=A0A9P8RFQ9_9PEZI|nr:cytochrome P450 [Truncatella angustata]KAH6645042.1 cytochrome P450 [Truncatella angustata]KAH8194084.1 hypothetical protein TruAng_011747 [Truncatella angustata]
METHYPSFLQNVTVHGNSQDLLLVNEIVDILLGLKIWQGLLLFACSFWSVTTLFTRGSITVANAPVHGYRSWFEPTWLFKLRYARDAHKIIASGYKKYNTADKPFVLRRQDHDVTILPNKYVSELRSIPNSKLSRGKANAMEWGDQWAMKTMWSHSELPIRAIGDNRNGRLARYLESMRKEFDYAYEVEMPQVDDWTEVDIQHIIRMILVRIIGKMIIGNPACRTPEWLEMGEHFTEDFVAASIIMRLLPPWLHPLFTNLIPQRWRLRRRLREARKIVEPAIARHQQAVNKKTTELDFDEEDSMMSWMMENGEDKDYVLSNMATLVLVILVPAAHTTAMAISNILFDLCVHPEWDTELRKEIRNVTTELGPIGKPTAVKDWVSRLELLDSFFNESQRLSQPISITPNRYATESFTFSDGLHVPKGALIGWVGIHNQIDPDITPDPKHFDPTRSYRKRHSSLDEETKHLAGQPSRENLSFGYGSQACPGRHIAVSVVKMVVSRLLLDYEFKSSGEKDKPKSIHLLEFIFPDPAAKLMMRKRQAM